MNEIIKVKYHDGEIEHFQKIEKGDWIDLRSRVTVDGKPGERIDIPLGISVQLPEGYEMLIAPRSSTYDKYGFIQVNTPAIIDESFCGDNDEIKCRALFLKDGHIDKGDRICQFRIIKHMPELDIHVVNQLGNADRGGYGSTGRN